VAVINQFHEEFTHRPQTSIEGKTPIDSKNIERQIEREERREVKEERE
jgi:hypothetical protein